MRLPLFNKIKAGIELSSEYISAALVQKKGGGCIVKDLTDAPLPHGLIKPSFKKENISDLQELKEYLVLVKQTLGFKKAAVSLPDSSVKIMVKKFDQLPDDEKSIKKMVIWEMASSLNFDPEEMRIAWQQAGIDADGRHTFIIALTLEPVIRQYESAFSLAGIQPVVISPSGLNQFNFYASGIPESGNVAYLGMFDELVNIFVFNQRVPVFYKTIKKGMLGEKGNSAINDVDLLIQYYHTENPDLEIDRFYIASSIKSESQIHQILHEEHIPEFEILDETSLVDFDKQVRFESNDRPLSQYTSVIGTAQGI